MKIENGLNWNGGDFVEYEEEWSATSQCTIAVQQLCKVLLYEKLTPALLLPFPDDTSRQLDIPASLPLSISLSQHAIAT
jgi:hypothetical protein